MNHEQYIQKNVRGRILKRLSGFATRQENGDEDASSHGCVSVTHGEDEPRAHRR